MVRDVRLQRQEIGDNAQTIVGNDSGAAEVISKVVVVLGPILLT